MAPVHSKNVQQELYDSLANRDYDCFQASDEKCLKLKIAYTVFGPPTNPHIWYAVSDYFTVAQLYNKEQEVHVDGIFKKIKSKSADPNEIIISFLFNCCEPVVDMEPPRANANKRNRTPTMQRFPVYRVRKCMDSPTGNNCCVFIDDHSRVYRSWDDYLENNKVPKARMYVPRDGKYKANENNEVLLSVLMSPACQLSAELKELGDATTTLASFVSGGIALSVAIPTITVAPVVLTGALITAACTGIYSIIRSAAALHDRNMHDQTISLRSSEARNCYLNIATGAMSVVTTGATNAARIAQNRGTVLSKNTRTALLGVNTVNMTVNGCNAINSMVSIVDQIKRKKNPSARDIMHMATTVLFFGNAVVNFKSAYTIYNQTHSLSMGTMLQSLKDSLLQEAKRMFFDADVTSGEVIESMHKVHDSDAFYLNMMGSMVSGGKDAWKQAAAKSVNTLLNWAPMCQFGYVLIKNRHNVWDVVRMILSRFEYSIQEKLVSLTKWLTGSVTKDIQQQLTRFFPQSEILVVLMNYVINYLKMEASKLEIEYQQKRAAAAAELEVTEEHYDKVCSAFKSQWERMAYFFKICVLKMFDSRGNVEELVCREMVRFFLDWLSDQTSKFMRTRQRKAIANRRQKIFCTVCHGHYFRQ